jgi:AhpD family alkylhydroperoxidase
MTGEQAMETATLQARIKHPVFQIPAALEGLRKFSEAARDHGVPAATLEMMNLRASQINGCSVCAGMHAGALKKMGESDERIWAVGAWREAVCLSDAERAALRLAEHVTRISDRSDPVPDAVWDAAAEHYDEEALAALVISLAGINAWNRLNVAVAQPTGEYRA